MCACVPAYVCMCLCACTCVCLCACMCVCLCACMCVCLCACMCVRACMCVHVAGCVAPMLTACSPTFTDRGHHALPFLEEGGFETVAGVEAIGLVARHQLLHGLQDDTQLVRHTQSIMQWTNETELLLHMTHNWSHTRNEPTRQNSFCTWHTTGHTHAMNRDRTSPAHPFSHEDPPENPFQAHNQKSEKLWT